MKATVSGPPIVIAIVLLLLPVLYVVSYLALVEPQLVSKPSTTANPRPYFGPYRHGGELAERFFWPVEQIDRKLRPKTWIDGLFYRPERSPKVPQPITRPGGPFDSPNARKIEQALSDSY